jgi:cell division protein FtsI (penicillin-binding protein 3)
MVTPKDLKRLVLVAIFLFLLFALLILQFYKIQIIEGEKWKKAANRQHYYSVTLPYERGVFYSNPHLRKGHPETPVPLVVDVPRFHLYADPAAIPPSCRTFVAETLRKIISLSNQEFENVTTHLSKKSRSRKLILWLEPEVKEAILKWWYPYARKHKIARNALFFVQDHKRSYPFGKLLGQLLHTVRAERDPKMRQCFPTGGLELFLNTYLKGEDGQRVILRSPRQSLDMGKVIKEPIHGSDVYLTIDHHLQAIVEEEIKKGVLKAKAKSGWAVIMEPHTGEILAWAQYPFFEPENCSDYFNDPKKQENTVIKAITVPFEPGSTIKPITLAIGLAANAERKKQGLPPLFSTNEKIAVSPRLFPGRTKPIKDLQTRRYLNFEMALQKSSNVYMATVIQRVVESFGHQWYLDQLEKVFGFGVKTGIELPAESSGFLPRLGKRYASGREEYSKPTPFSLAMGYNLMANTLQMMRCYSILANGGFEVKPTLIKKIVSKEGKVLFEKSQKLPKQILASEVVSTVVRGMRYTTKMGGTAGRADIPGYTEVGKTATSEKVVNGIYSKKDHISTFIGFAPAVNPSFVLSVVIDDPAYETGATRSQLGGICGAPVFAEIGLKSLQYLGVTPDDPNNDQWLQEMNELKKLHDAWN